jgi:hypothetical protein
VALGSSAAIQNSQCTATLVSAAGSGASLALTVNLTFKPAFGGNKIAYLAARNQAEGNSAGSRWRPGAVLAGGKHHGDQHEP